MPPAAYGAAARSCFRHEHHKQPLCGSGVIGKPLRPGQVQKGPCFVRRRGRRACAAAGVRLCFSAQSAHIYDDWRSPCTSVKSRPISCKEPKAERGAANVDLTFSTYSTGIPFSSHNISPKEQFPHLGQVEVQLLEGANNNGARGAAGDGLALEPVSQDNIKGSFCTSVKSRPIF